MTIRHQDTPHQLQVNLQSTLPAWRLLFWLALAMALFALLAPATVILDLKIWVASWWPLALDLEHGDALRHADKGLHTAIFLVLGALGLRAWSNPRQRNALFLGLLAMAFATEGLQAGIPGRSTELGDVLADLAGLLLGGLLRLPGRGRRAAALGGTA